MHARTITPSSHASPTNLSGMSWALWLSSDVRGRPSPRPSPDGMGIVGELAYPPSCEKRLLQTPLVRLYVYISAHISPVAFHFAPAILSMVMRIGGLVTHCVG